MIIAQSVPLGIDRGAPRVFTIEISGIDLTGADLHAQIRLTRDAPGDPIVDLPKVTDPTIAGVRLLATDTSGTLPVSWIRLQIPAMATGTGAGQLPPAAELGDDLTVYWDMFVTPSGRTTDQWFYGPVTVSATVTRATTLPALVNDPLPGADAVATLMGADLTVTLAGAALIQPLIDRADGSAAAALAAAGRAGTKAQEATDAAAEVQEQIGSLANPGSSTFVDDSNFKGGYRAVPDIASRNAIAANRRRAGMRVKVLGDDGAGVAGRSFELASDLQTWVGLATSAELRDRATQTGTQTIDTIDAFRLERRYAYGRLVAHARVDPNYGLGDAITADGYHMAKYAIRVTGMGWTRNAADGFWELDGTQLLNSAPSIRFTDGSSIAPSRTLYYNGLAVRWAVTGPDGVTSPMFVLEDGSVVVQKLSSPSILTPAAVAALPFPNLNLAGGGSVDSNSLRYYNGHAVRKAWTDADGRASIIELDDGTIVIPKLSSPAVITDPSGFSFGAVNFSTGDTIVTMAGSRYFAGRKIKKAWTDSGLGASLVELDDGTIVIPKLSSPALDLAGGVAPLETGDYVFSEIVVGSLKQLRRTSKIGGIRKQITATGNNYAPRLSADGTKVIYISDRSGTKEGWYQLLSGAKLGGAVEHPVAPRSTTLLSLGDSLTAGGYADLVATAFGISVVSPTSASVVAGGPTAGGGIGSQRSDQIAARYGTWSLTCSLAGNTMTAGANTLSAISLSLLGRSSDTPGAIRTLRASILGVAGLLTAAQQADGSNGAIQYETGSFYLYTFTPDAGQTLPAVVAAGAALVIDPETRQDCPLLDWHGRNDVGSFFASGNINMTAQPNPGDVVTLTVNGIANVIQFVAEGSGGAGRVEIGAAIAKSRTNLAEYIAANFADGTNLGVSGTATLAATVSGNAVAVVAKSGMTALAIVSTSASITIAALKLTGWCKRVMDVDDANMAGYKPFIRNIVLVSVTNAKTEYIGSPGGEQNYRDIVALNLARAAKYPDNFCDVRSAYCAGTANDVPADTLTADDIHYNNAGKIVIANVLIAFIQARGWFA